MALPLETSQSQDAETLTTVIHQCGRSSEAWSRCLSKLRMQSRCLGEDAWADCILGLFPHLWAILSCKMGAVIPTLKGCFGSSLYETLTMMLCLFSRRWCRGVLHAVCWKPSAHSLFVGSLWTDIWWKNDEEKNTESASKEMELCVCVVYIVYKISIYHIVK